jgi:predicted MFS family arabinose efflux permease
MVGAFSLGLLVSGMAAYSVGKLIRRFGGRLVMSLGSVLAALALFGVASSPTLPALYIGWILAGAAMAATLYEPAFATLTEFYGADIKRPLTIVTLAGGFASTVFWPLTGLLAEWLGWRETLLVYAGLHLVICLPLHALGLRGPTHRRAGGSRTRPLALPDLLRESRFRLLAVTYAANAGIFSVVSVHLIPAIQSAGVRMQDAAWLAAAAGPMQVVGRLTEFLLGNRRRTVQTGRTALLLLIPALAGLAVPDAPTTVLLGCITLYGISNGVMTIVRALTAAQMFGAENYAQVSGAWTPPQSVARAVGPFLASVFLSSSASYSYLMVALSVLAVFSMLTFIIAHRQDHDLTPELCSAPQRGRSPVGEGPTQVVVGRT